MPLMNSLDPRSLKKLALAIGRIVSENLDYWRLMYIDVVEFRHKHFQHSFREIAGGLRTYSSALFREIGKFPSAKGVDPGPGVHLDISAFFYLLLG